MNSRLLKVCGWGVILLCLATVDAQAGGRRRCHSQSYYTAAPTTAQPMVSSANNGRVQYQSAYQAPSAPVQYYNYNGRSANTNSNRWDAQQHFARHIKGLE